MKHLFGPLESRLETALLIIITIVILSLAPWIYGTLIPFFALLDQQMLFNAALAVTLLGIVVYTVLQSRKVLNVPYAVSAFVFGTAGFAFWGTIIEMPAYTMLYIGMAATAIIVFRRGLLVDVVTSSKAFWKSTIVGIISAIVFFLATNFLLSFIFPEMSEVLRYSISTILLLLGAHIHNRSLVALGTTRFAFDMTLLVIFYNFLMFSSRITAESLLNISLHLPVYGSAITSTVYGIALGLIGAYVLHRHHRMWVSQESKRNQNMYTLTIIAGALALSFIFGANPFITAGMMGLLVTIRDNNDNPEDHMLVRAESVIAIIVFLVLGSTISFAALLWLVPFGSVAVLFITIFSMAILSTLFYLAGKMNLLPNAKWRSYIYEVTQKEDSPILIGSLALFALSYGRGEGELLSGLSIILVLVVYYVYPWLLHVMHKDASKSE